MTVKTQDELRAKMASGQEHVGDMVWWKCHSNSDKPIPRDHVVKAWQEAGIDLAYVPAAPSGENRVSQAITDVAPATRRPNVPHSQVKKLKDSWVVDIIKTDENLGNESLGRVILDKKTDRLTIESGSGNPIVIRMVERFNEYENAFGGGDVSVLFSGTVKGFLRGFPLRPTGGVYFVPSTSAATLRALQAAVTRIPNSRCHISTLEISQGTVGLQNVATAARDNLIAEIEQIQTEIKTLIEHAEEPEARATKSTAFATLNSRLAELVARLQVYEGVLSINLQDIKSTLDNYRQKLGIAEDVADSMKRASSPRAKEKARARLSEIGSLAPVPAEDVVPQTVVETVTITQAAPVKKPGRKYEKPTVTTTHAPAPVVVKPVPVVVKPSPATAPAVEDTFF